MVKVALFFDGKNFYKGLERATGDRYFDYERGARWLVRRVNGNRFVGAHYYTGIYREPDTPEAPNGLREFLDTLEMRDGFFVYRFPRRARTRECPHCKMAIEYTEEKEVDTRIVSDMLGLAASGTYDTAILLAGDTDHAPGLEALRSLGKIIYVATWGERDLSRRLRRAAFGFIDLVRELPEEIWKRPVGSTALVPPADDSPSDAASDSMGLPDGLLPPEEAVLRELRRAEARFSTTGGFVGYHYFLTRWRGSGIYEDAHTRMAALDSLKDQGFVELFDRDGTTAIRTVPASPAEAPPSADTEGEPPGEV